MKKQIFKSLFTIACLLFSTNASAYDFEVNGIYYTVESFTKLTCNVVSGEEKYKGDVVIPATVDYNGKTLTVVGIYSLTFWYCSDLTSITIPNTVSSIDYIGTGCDKLEYVKIEDGEKALTIGGHVFEDCPIVTLYVGRNLSYGSGVDSPFYGVKTIKNLTIGESVTEISSYEFYGCDNIASVIIPNSVTQIYQGAFSGCSGLTSVTLGNSLVRLGEYAFYGCSNLTNITIPNSVTRIDSYAFYGCYSLTTMVIPDAVTLLGAYVFYDCGALADITIGNSVTEIGTLAFYNCTNLINVTLGNSIKKINSSAFENCSSLTTITLPCTVTSIGSSAFYGCSGLSTLYSLNTTPPSIKGFENDHYLNLNVYVPQEALEAYQNADGWMNFWNLHGFVSTEIKNVVPNISDIKEIKRYDAAGRESGSNHKGLTIIKMSDGTTKKVMVK